jgi:hypothetical protein
MGIIFINSPLNSILPSLFEMLRQKHPQYGQTFHVKISFRAPLKKKPALGREFIIRVIKEH